MRIYLALSPADFIATRLQEAIAFAVTPWLCSHYDLDNPEDLHGDSLEEAEAYALEQASALSLLIQEGNPKPRRVVAALDAQATAIDETQLDGLVAQGMRALPGMVHLQEKVDFGRIVSFHIDEPDAHADLVAALSLDPEGVDSQLPSLLWYDAVEFEAACALLEA